MTEKTIIIEIPPVEEWTLTDLRHTCRHNKVKGYTKMKKEQLVKEVERIIRNGTGGKDNVE